MNRYRLYDINCDDFEKIVILLCQKILGDGTVSFSKGPDGGRDGAFQGKANSFPSISNPWDGKVVIQAKHTENPVAKCADPEFKGTILKEVEKIKKLVEAGEADYYILFTNRKLSGSQEIQLKNTILKTGIKDANIIGIESINLYLNQFSDIVKICSLNSTKQHFNFKADDLKDIIIKFYEHRGNIIPDKTTAFNYNRPKIQKKNEINNLSEGYYNYIEQDSVPYFKDIDDFLKNPRNKEVLDYYYNISDELNSKLAILRQAYDCFDDIFIFIYDHIVGIHNELKDKKRLINVFMHYMYFHCDLGLGHNLC